MSLRVAACVLSLVLGLAFPRFGAQEASAAGLELKDPDGLSLLKAHVQLAPGVVLESLKESDGRRLELDLGLFRARLRAEGHAGTQDLTYFLQVHFPEGEPALLDGYFDVSLASSVRLRAGRMKRPWDRQFLIPPHRLATPERALTSRVFSSRRDEGLMVHSGDESVFEWALGIFRGNYESPSQVGRQIRREEELEPAERPQARPVLALRLARRAPGAYDESDKLKTPLRWSIGLGALVFLPKDDLGGAFQAQVDLHLAHRGFTLSGAAFVATEQDGKGYVDQAFESVGYYVQSSLLLGELFEPSLRFTHLVFGTESSDVKDIRLGVTFSFYGSLLRWLNSVGMTKRDIPGGYRSDVTLRSTLELNY